MTTTTKKFNCKSATKVSFDREIKRLASHKCLTGQKIRALTEAGEPVPEELQAKYDAILTEYSRVREAKAKKYGRKTYMDYTQAEIDALDLKQTVAGIASLACTRSRYPGRADEARKQEARFQAHKTKLQHAAEVQQTLKGLSKEELEALLADAK